jgi:hypothetical protein
MTYPRRIVHGTTYLLTRRCTQRRFMLVPRGIVPELFGYCVALAAERHGVLAPNASWRKKITSQAAAAGGVRRSAPCRPARTSGQPPTPRPRG